TISYLPTSAWSSSVPCMLMSSALFGGDPAEAGLSSFSGLPSDLQDDAAVVLNTLNEFYVAMDDLGLDLADSEAFASMTPQQAAAFSEIGEKLDTVEFSEASENLSAYADAECDGG
ncbi:MAG: hypothetical protein P8N02_10475, partial [Actinomycetota bacterium]|nr:hypothetical protein [Actinomycetota bacterium]